LYLLNSPSSRKRHKLLTKHNVIRPREPGNMHHIV
jgi:hypothetical protein